MTGQHLPAMEDLLAMPRVQGALAYLEEDDARTLQEHLALCVIPAPTFGEAARARYMLEKFTEAGLEDVGMDALFNVTGRIRGQGGPTTVLAAHLDTVFPAGTPLVVTEADGVYRCPGISDDARGLAELLTIARAVNAAGIVPARDILFCANACEEGLGDLRGIRRVFESGEKVGAFITIDNPQTEAVIFEAVGSVRHKVTFTGSGGHSFGDFGLPNPIHAMGRAIAKISGWQVPAEPKTTFSVGVVEGGTSVNTIAASAAMLVDIRSLDPARLTALAQKLRADVCSAAGEETARWDGPEHIGVSVERIGQRPSGRQPRDCAIVDAACAALEAVGLAPAFPGPGSTDANIPISLGIPAVAVGCGGSGGKVHTTGEWFSSAQAFLGAQKNLLLLLAMAGVAG